MKAEYLNIQMSMPGKEKVAILMKIVYVEIQNFRKLKSCRIAFGDKETVFVGANNSGKTSAIDALILFLKKERQKEISTTDFTLSNWYQLNELGKRWVEVNEDDELEFNLSLWHPHMPSVDIWLEVKESEIHYISHLIPTLSWSGGLLGVRLCLEPKKIEDLYKDYLSAYNAAKNAASKKPSLSLWPKDLKEFLEKRLHSYFSVKAYLLDPSKNNDPKDGVAIPQDLPETSIPLDFDPFKGLFKIDLINAQRGFSDAKTSDSPGSNNSGNLTTQLRSYYDRHLNPSVIPEEEDIDALEAIEEAQKKFDDKLKSSFKSAISELEGLGYPGFSDPKITLSCKVNPIENLNHDSSVQFDIGGDHGTSPLSLPEKYNGLGYQNLVSMVFKLISFRDEWMRKGKASHSNDNEDIIEPLHLILIEEPEAHLHAQVQQVFIKKAYDVLRNNDTLKDSDLLSTQMIVSTHSSHIAHEIDFKCLRYFRKNPAILVNDVPSTVVVNLSTTFGEENDTTRFATRYLKTTHCDLFFADAVILVEGPAERMLIPYFITNEYEKLDSRYISILEIGGSHAHRLKPLIEDLGLTTLVITDIDSIEKETIKKIQPERGKDYRTGNTTLKDWLPKKVHIDDLFELDNKEKKSENNLIRVAYQYPFNIIYMEDECEVIPYTFEDALVFTNQSIFKELNSSTGLIKKINNALNEQNVTGASTEIFKALEKGKKAEMALELFYLEDSTISTPNYIAEGLLWLQAQLESKDCDYIAEDTLEGDV